MIAGAAHMLLQGVHYAVSAAGLSTSAAETISILSADGQGWALFPVVVR